MKKIILTLTAVLGVCLIAANVYAAPTLTTTINATVGDVFSLEFYTDANVLASDVLAFSDITPTAYNYPDGRVEGDGKSDIGLLANSNRLTAWHLTMKITTTDLNGKVGATMSQPINRNTGSSASGALGHAPDVWFNLLSTDDTIYSHPANDISTPQGVLATLSFKIDGESLTPGPKTGVITYTLVEG